MKGLFFVLLAALLSACGSAPVDGGLTKKQLKEIAKKESARAPRMLDKDIEFLGVKVKGYALDHKYRLIYYAHDELDSELFINEVKPEFLHDSCVIAKSYHWLEKGVTLIHSFFGNDGRLIDQIIITKDQCRFSPGVES